jgi:hypothetical protein
VLDVNAVEPIPDGTAAALMLESDSELHHDFDAAVAATTDCLLADWVASDPEWLVYPGNVVYRDSPDDRGPSGDRGGGADAREQLRYGPAYQSPEEIQSTRSRANALRAAISGDLLAERIGIAPERAGGVLDGPAGCGPGPGQRERRRAAPHGRGRLVGRLRRAVGHSDVPGRVHRPPVRRICPDRGREHPRRLRVHPHVRALRGTDLRPPAESLAYHGHCNQKALNRDHHAAALLRRAGYTVDHLDSSYCGMAGSFGDEAEHYERSQAIGRILFEQVRL